MILQKSAANPRDRQINAETAPFLIAEFGLNHNRDIALACRMADAAREAGVDAVKLQSYTTKYFINRRFENVHGLYDIFAGLELDLQFHRELRDYCVKAGLVFFSTPLTTDWVTHLKDLAAPALKIASGDVNNWQLIDAAIATGLPLIVSTGAASDDEVRLAAKRLGADAAGRFALLHCVSLYPTPLEKANISRMARLAGMVTHEVPVGFSDHTEGTAAAFTAVAAGAQIIEKHFTLDKNLPGPDQKMSSDPREIAELRRQIDLAWKIRGNAKNADCHREETAGDYYGKRAMYDFEGQRLAMRPRHPDFPRP